MIREFAEFEPQPERVVIRLDDLVRNALGKDSHVQALITAAKKK